jgi:hypothetical protein
LLLVDLALAARDSASGGRFLIETSFVDRADSGDPYASLTITQNGAGAELPMLDEIVRQAQGEMRVSHEPGITRVYLPQLTGARH